MSDTESNKREYLRKQKNEKRMKEHQKISKGSLKGKHTHQKLI